MIQCRDVAFAVSIESSMQQWARQDRAPAGSAMVVHSEISARLRRGDEWRSPGGLAVAVLARPTQLESGGVGLCWLAAGLGAAEALSEATSTTFVCQWPDQVSEPTLAADAAIVNISSALGPGRIDHAILVVRLPGPLAGRFDRAGVAAMVVDRLRQSIELLDQPGQLVSRYTAVSSLIGNRVKVAMPSTGAIRGAACEFDMSGRLVVESATGLRRSIGVDEVRTVELR